MKIYRIFKDDLEEFLRDISRAEAECNTYVNVRLKPCDTDDTKIIVIVG